MRESPCLSSRVQVWDPLTHVRQVVIGEVSGKLVSTSKFFKPEEVWTQKEAWWFQIPIDRIQSASNDFCYLVGEYQVNGFVILKVTNQFLLENLEKFDTKTENRIQLHLAAYPENWLVDERVKNGVNFSKFELK
mgnify:CR=1 FL=1